MRTGIESERGGEAVKEEMGGEAELGRGERDTHTHTFTGFTERGRVTHTHRARLSADGEEMLVEPRSTRRERFARGDGVAAQASSAQPTVRPYMGVTVPVTCPSQCRTSQRNWWQLHVLCASAFHAGSHSLSLFVSPSACANPPAT